jgi:arylformamidase
MLFDVSLSIEPDMVTWPSDPKVEIELYKDLNKGDSSTVSMMKLGSHTGTHIDAPLHMIKGGKSVDELDLELLYGKVLVVEIKDKKSIKRKEIEAIDLNGISRIIFKTRNSEIFPKGKFDEEFVYLEPETAEYLVENGTRLVGVDAPSIDGYKCKDHPTHQVLMANSVVIIELLDLSRVKNGMFRLIALPLKIKGGDGAPARVVLKAI